MTQSGEDPTKYEYRISLEYTPCNFGGVRPGFNAQPMGAGSVLGHFTGRLSGTSSRVVNATTLDI